MCRSVPGLLGRVFFCPKPSTETPISCYSLSVTFLLVGINAKFIQSNLAIRLIRAYAGLHAPSVQDGRVSVQIAEWNVNMQTSTIVRGLYEHKADVVIFSTYIWNRETVFRAAGELKTVAPGILVGAGGPEVTYDPEKAFTDCASLDFVIKGEGEATVAELVERFGSPNFPEAFVGVPDFGRPGSAICKGVAGLAYRDVNGSVRHGPERPLLRELGVIPFPYGYESDDLDPETRIVYYESSRGCPYSCAYCLSSIERSVRFYPLDRVFSDLNFFLERRWPLVKFVDRTFNIDPVRYRAIWKYIAAHYNGVTRFHFEISADLLGEEDFSILERMPDGAIQFEIGIQSANPETLQAVHRKTDLRRLAETVIRLPKTIHSHVDLIAGLPHENLESFARSFDYAFSLGTDVVQLGFLKILAGTDMERMALQDRGFTWSSYPPYEILSSPEMSYDVLSLLKDVEHVVDNLWNSGGFKHSLGFLASLRTSAFAFFRELAHFMRTWFPDGDLFLPRRQWDLYACLAAYIAQTGENGALERLKFDFFMQAKPGRIPEWMIRRTAKEAHDAALEISGFLTQCGGVRRLAYARSEYEEFDFRDGSGITGFLFKYPSPEHKSLGTCFEKIPYNGF